MSPRNRNHFDVYTIKCLWKRREDIKEIVSISIPNGNITCIVIRRTARIYIQNKVIKITNKIIPSFPMKTLKCLEDMQAFLRCKRTGSLRCQIRDIAMVAEHEKLQWFAVCIQLKTALIVTMIKKIEKENISDKINAVCSL